MGKAIFHTDDGSFFGGQANVDELHELDGTPEEVVRLLSIDETDIIEVGNAGGELAVSTGCCV